MKTALIRSLIAVLFCACVPFAFPGEFQSKTIAPTTSLPVITIPDGHFLRIRNFTQDGGSIRGRVSVILGTGGTATNILTAAKIDTTPPETINSVVIAGPATVTVTAGDATTFITYKKDLDSD